MAQDLELKNANELTNIDAELEQEAKKIATALVGSPTISTQGGRFKFPDDHVVTGPLNLIVIDARITKQMWFKDFNDLKPGENNGLLCAATGDQGMDRNTLVPFDSAPQKQNPVCNECPQNRWERDASGNRVKIGSCKDGIAFAVMAPDLQPDDIYLIRGSATGVTEAVKLIQLYKSKYIHPVKAVTEFSFVPTNRGAMRLSVKDGGPNARYAEHAGYRQRAAEMLEATPRWYENSAPAAQAPQSAAPTKSSGNRPNRSAAVS